MTPRPEPETRARILECELANAHWDAAIDAITARDDAAYEREMAAFRRISSGWTGAQGRREANNLPSAAA